MAQVEKTYKYCNSGEAAATNVNVTIPSEDGYVYVTYSVTTGSYNVTNKVWSIPSVAAGECETITITYNVSAQTSCTENCGQDATASPVNINHGNTYTINGVIPCSSLCTEGTTLIEVVGQSDNVSVDIDASSGNYTVTVTDVTLDWYFDYTIKCIHCDDVTTPFGPGRVEGSAPDPELLPYFIGEVRMYGGTTEPTGWAFCDGSILLVEDEPDLFAVIGNTFGGDGVTDFALPDFRSKFPIGVGTGVGLTARALADTGGAEEVTLVEGNLPSHNHNVTIGSNTELATTNAAGGNTLGDGANIYNTDPAELGEELGSVTQDSVGSDTPFSIINPFLALNFIIAKKGFNPIP